MWSDGLSFLAGPLASQLLGTPQSSEGRKPTKTGHSYIHTPQTSDLRARPRAQLVKLLPRHKVLDLVPSTA